MIKVPETDQKSFQIRKAVWADIPELKALMALSIATLQAGFLSPAQIEASHRGMGLDTQLIEDQTYFCVTDGDVIVGCGGWSNRATLYGGNHSAGRNMARLDPKVDRARIRAMYSHPKYARRGIGKMILSASEEEARDAGFSALEMAATLSGEPFYLKAGYHVESRWEDQAGPVPVPLLKMTKMLTSEA